MTLVLVFLISLSVIQGLFLLWGDSFTGRVITLNPSGGEITVSDNDQFAVNGKFVEIVSVGSQGITVLVDGVPIVINGLEFRVTDVPGYVGQERITLLVQDLSSFVSYQSFGAQLSLHYGDLVYVDDHRVKVLPTLAPLAPRVFVDSVSEVLHISEGARVNDVLVYVTDVTDFSGEDYDLISLVVLPASRQVDSANQWPRYTLAYHDPVTVYEKELVFLGIGPSGKAQFSVSGRYGTVKLYDEEYVNGLTLFVEYAVDANDNLFDSVTVTVAPDLTDYAYGRP